MNRRSLTTQVRYKFLRTVAIASRLNQQVLRASLAGEPLPPVRAVFIVAQR